MRNAIFNSLYHIVFLLVTPLLTIAASNHLFNAGWQFDIETYSSIFVLLVILEAHTTD